MSFRRFALAAVLVDFLALTGWVIAEHGPLGWLPDLLAQPVGILVAVDLTIALLFAVGWMFADARRTGRNPWPYLGVTLLTGSAGPLLYMVLRREPAAETTSADPLAAR